MSAQEYTEGIRKMGLTQLSAATLFGVSLRTSHGYAHGHHAVSSYVAILLRLMLAGKVAIKDVEACHGK